MFWSDYLAKTCPFRRSCLENMAKITVKDKVLEGYLACMFDFWNSRAWEAPKGGETLQGGKVNKASITSFGNGEIDEKGKKNAQTAMLCAVFRCKIARDCVSYYNHLFQSKFQSSGSRQLAPESTHTPFLFPLWNTRERLPMAQLLSCPSLGE